jgi:ATP-dependent Clp protease adaptor protein ClpS
MSDEKKSRNALIRTTGSRPALPEAPQNETEGLTITKPRPKMAKPSLYRVLLLNDDFTPMDFVVHVLQKFFNKPEPDATRIMLQVHEQGSGLAGIFTFEVAETKTYLVNEYAKGRRHPLKCVMERESE